MESSTPQSSTVIAVGGGSNVGLTLSGSGSAAIIGAVVAVVVILIVVSVIVAAVLIAWRVSRREKKAAIGEQNVISFHGLV